MAFELLCGGARAQIILIVNWLIPWFVDFRMNLLHWLILWWLSQTILTDIASRLRTWGVWLPFLVKVTELWSRKYIQSCRVHRGWCSWSWLLFLKVSWICKNWCTRVRDFLCWYFLNPQVQALLLYIIIFGGWLLAAFIQNRYLLVHSNICIKTKVYFLIISTTIIISIICTCDLFQIYLLYWDTLQPYIRRHGCHSERITTIPISVHLRLIVNDGNTLSENRTKVWHSFLHGFCLALHQVIHFVYDVIILEVRPVECNAELLSCGQWLRRDCVGLWTWWLIFHKRLCKAQLLMEVVNRWFALILGRLLELDTVLAWSPSIIGIIGFRRIYATEIALNDI